MKNTWLGLSLVLLVGCAQESDPVSNPGTPAPEVATGWDLRPRDSDPTPHVVQRYDANGNGVLDPSERQAMRERMEARRQWQQEERLQKYDSNGDGKLGLIEAGAARQEEQRARGARHAIALEKYDTNRDGVLDDTERAAMTADRDAFLAGVKIKVLAAYDRNLNGRLDPEEQDQLRNRVREMRNAAR
jgi:Ca2+-binding EF-hand superfamily protein